MAGNIIEGSRERKMPTDPLAFVGSYRMWTIPPMRLWVGKLMRCSAHFRIDQLQLEPRFLKKNFEAPGSDAVNCGRSTIKNRIATAQTRGGAT